MSELEPDRGVRQNPPTIAKRGPSCQRRAAALIARESGWLRITLEEDGVELTDALQRRVTATVDHAPEVSFLEPDSDRVIELADEIRIDWEATDDHGVRAVDLVVRTPAGEQRRRLARTSSGETSARDRHASANAKPSP